MLTKVKLTCRKKGPCRAQPTVCYTHALLEALGFTGSTCTSGESRLARETVQSSPGLKAEVGNPRRQRRWRGLAGVSEKTPGEGESELDQEDGGGGRTIS